MHDRRPPLTVVRRALSHSPTTRVLVLGMLFSLLALQSIGASGNASGAPARLQPTCPQGFSLDENTGACVENSLPVRQTEPTQTPIPVRPTAGTLDPTPPPLRPTAVPATEPVRPTAVPTVGPAPNDAELLDPCNIDPPNPQDSSCQNEPDLTVPEGSLNGVPADFRVVDHHCSNTTAAYATFQDAQNECVNTWQYGHQFTLTSGPGSASIETIVAKDGMSAHANWPDVPQGPYSLSRDSLQGISSVAVFCSRSYTIGAINYYDYPEPVTMSAPGTIEGLIEHPGESATIVCHWFNISDDPQAAAPALIPRDIPQLVPICDPDDIQIGGSTTCAPQLPDGLETFPICNSDPGLGDQSTNCVPDLTVPADTLMSGSSTLRLITVNCATYDSGWEAIDDAYAACVESEASGLGLTLTTGADTSHKVSASDPALGSTVVWNNVPEGPFTIAPDPNPDYGDPTVFCSWEAQNTDAEELEYSVAYDLLMPISDDGAMEGVIEYPGTDYLCVWFNIPAPERADPSG